MRLIKAELLRFLLGGFLVVLVVGQEAEAKFQSHTLDPETVLAKARSGIAKGSTKDAYSNHSRLKSMAEDVIKRLYVKQEFKTLFGAFKTDFSKEDYGSCADIASRMEDFIPKDHPTEYPFAKDFLIQWRAEIGTLRSHVNDYQGALQEFDLARSMKSPDDSPYRKDAGLAHAAYGQAQMHALLGRKQEALKYLAEAPGLYWSGCGTCTEAEASNEKRMRTVWDAASKPDDVAETKLLKIVDGHYQPYKSALLGDPTWQIKAAQVEAAFMLGELYLKQNRKDLAKRSFEVVMAGGHSGPRQMAVSRLKQLK